MKKIIYILIFISSYSNIIYAQQVTFYSQEIEFVVKTYLGLQPADIITKQQVDTITKLDCSGLGIIDLNDFYNFPKLINLDLSSNNIKDITPLACLANLQYLDLSNNEIDEIYPLADAASEKMLINVSNNYIKIFSEIYDSPRCIFTLIGTNAQRLKISSPKYNVSTLTFWELKKVGNISTFEIFYDSYASDDKKAVLNFGNGQSELKTADGLTHSDTMDYTANNKYILSLSLEDKSITDTLDLTISGIKTISSTSFIKLYPNPVTNTLKFAVNNNYQGIIKVKLLDISGRIIQHQQFMKSNEILSKEISLINYQSGIYFFECQIGNKKYSEKLLINK